MRADLVAPIDDEKDLFVRKRSSGLLCKHCEIWCFDLDETSQRAVASAGFPVTPGTSNHVLLGANAYILRGRG
jgi:hypothetical protein